MQEREWVVDTWVLETALRPDQNGLAAVSFLHEILEHHCIGIDSDGHIQREYERHLHAPSHAAFWWRSIVKRGNICWRSGSLARRHRDHLLNKLRFDPSDVPFVTVAAKGPDKFLVSEERHYSQQVTEYLSKLGVKVLGLRESLNLSRDP